MDLRSRLNLLITLLFISLFFCSSYYIIINTRNTVQREVETTTRIAIQLIHLAIASATEQEGADKPGLLENLMWLDEARHFHIEINNPSAPPGKRKSIISTTEVNITPAWFYKLIAPPTIEMKRWLYNPAIAPIDIVIRADPTSEINESWTEVRGILILLLIFTSLGNLFIYVMVGKYLAPVKTILSGLSDIGQGNYKVTLPQFQLTEFNQIAQRFNHMVKVLSKSKLENQLLTRKSLVIQELERRHLAQELHDDLGQTITAIKAVAVAIENNQNINTQSLNSSVRMIIDHSDHIYQSAKNMMLRLRPAGLDEFGLVKALQNMIDDWNSRQDEVFCQFTFTNIPEHLPELISISLFRIVQESLTNVLKHSGANQVTIKITQTKAADNDYINLNIHDNGIGLVKKGNRQGLGLLGMRERVGMNRGKMNLTNPANGGLMISITVPVGVSVQH